ncbi:MAG: VanW family protein [Anaerolineae bacterium]|nr:VanW family protein [Anaerolineae bacterium]
MRWLSGATAPRVSIGNGICQVPTTVFQAAFWGSMPIVRRWAHGVRGQLLWPGFRHGCDYLHAERRFPFS